MKVAMIGTGYVGLVSGACFAEFGAHVTGVDSNPEKIAKLKAGGVPIFEPGLEKLIAENSAAGRLAFTTDLAAAAKEANIVFICVGTPTAESSRHADLSQVFGAAEAIADALEGFTVVATKSTVPVGTGEKIRQRIKARNPKADFAIASNPEFLREGSAIRDFMHPDRIVVGCEDERARKAMYSLYRPLYLNETPMLYTDIPTAELIKYAANCFLATKIGFINEMADLCEKVGANVQDVARGMGLDGRIGSKFLHVSPGFGGSCFPKDTRALTQIAQDAGSPVDIVEAVVRKNDERKLKMVDKIWSACHPERSEGSHAAGDPSPAAQDDKAITLAILGLTFKPMTDDMRESASLAIVPELLRRGAKLRAYDPEGMENAKALLPQKNITWCTDAYDAMQGADAAVILTEWNEFRNLDLDKTRAALHSPLIIDLRNIYKPQEVRESGFTYVSLGRK